MKKIFAYILSIVLSFCFFYGCNPSGKQNEAKYIKEDSEHYIINNGFIGMTIDKKNGFIDNVQNVPLKKYIKKRGSGNWPFALEYGADLKPLSLNSSNKNNVTSAKITNKDNVEVLNYEYSNLKTDDSTQTGISAKIKIEIGEKSYFKISASFDLSLDNENGGIYSLKMLDGGELVAPKSEADKIDKLTAPTWNGGMYWDKPSKNKNFYENEGITLGYPGADNRSLEAGWLDYSSDLGGVGIALINKQQLATEFRVKAITENSKTLSISNVLFDPKQILGKNDLHLAKGDNFTSDEMLVITHNGDWHNTADVYREEYQKAFVTPDGKPDYLTEETLSNNAKRGRYIMRGIAGLNKGTPENPSLGFNKFEDMQKDTFNMIDEFGGNKNEMMFWLTGQNERGYAFDVPMMTPIIKESGGEKGLTDLTNYIKNNGGQIYHYEHPFAVDPVRMEKEEPGIMAKVDPKQRTAYWDACNHQAVCIDNQTMNNFWDTKVLPPIVALAPNGIMLDQCSLQQTVCDLSGHNHKLDATSRLGSHSKGVINLEKKLRSSVNDGYLVTEGRSDILSRYVDISQQCWHHDVLWNGHLAFGVGQYTHPNYIYQPSTLANVYNNETNRYEIVFTTLKGALYGGIVSLSDGESSAMAREYIRFKNEIFKQEAPGYPFGFKDNVGIKTSTIDLDAKVFVEGNSVTVTYLTEYHVQNATITIDFEKLGFANKGQETFSVSDSMHKLGFKVFNL